MSKQKPDSSAEDTNTPASLQTKKHRNTSSTDFGSKLVTKAAVSVAVRLIPIGIVAVLIFAAISTFLPVFGKPLIELVLRTEKTSSDLVLKEIKDIYALNSVEYMHKVVFPFDFMKPNISEASMIAKLKNNLNRNLRDILSPDEILYLQVRDLAAKHNMNVNSPKFEFLVATIVVRAGFDLKDTPFERSDLSEEDQKRFVNIFETRTDEKVHRSIVVNLPPAIITDVRIEDPIRDQYPFPGITITPQAWGEIAEFMQNHAVTASLKTGILDTAKQNAAVFLMAILKQAGFDAIRIESDGIEIQSAQ